MYCGRLSARGEDTTINFADDGVGFIETGCNTPHGPKFVKQLMEEIGGSTTLFSDHCCE
jgi:hypothetical protein